MPLFSLGGTDNILNSETLSFPAYVSNTTFKISPGVTFTLDTPTIYGSASFSLGTNTSDASGVELILNAGSVSSGVIITFNDALSVLVIGVDELTTIDVPASGTGPFTAETNPNPGLPLIGGFDGTIDNFQVGDHIIVDTTAAATFSQSGAVVSVIANGTTLGVLTFENETQANLAFSTSGALVDQVVCFVRGTHIATPTGEVSVEALSIGDEVMTTSGKRSPITWIGRREVATRFADPLSAWPIRIKANALADGVPSRDLLLSPDHAILISDILLQAGALVNGTSIARETNVPEILTYYHIELDDHSLILAENTPSETFVDNVDRLAFDNWEEYQALHPEGKPILEMPYPRAKAYRQVPRTICERLAARGAALYGSLANAA